VEYNVHRTHGNEEVTLIWLKVVDLKARRFARSDLSFSFREQVSGYEKRLEMTVCHGRATEFIDNKVDWKRMDGEIGMED
jgi:hypothetical protein